MALKGMWGLRNSIVIMMSNLIRCFASKIENRMPNFVFVQSILKIKNMRTIRNGPFLTF